MVEVAVAVGLRWSPGFEDRTCRRQVNAERLGVAPACVRQAMGPQRLNMAVDGNADCGAEVFQSRILDHFLARGKTSWICGASTMSTFADHCRSRSMIIGSRQEVVTPWKLMALARCRCLGSR